MWLRGAIEEQRRKRSRSIRPIARGCQNSFERFHSVMYEWTSEPSAESLHAKLKLGGRLEAVVCASRLKRSRAAPTTDGLLTRIPYSRIWPVYSKNTFRKGARLMRKCRRWWPSTAWTSLHSLNLSESKETKEVSSHWGSVHAHFVGFIETSKAALLLDEIEFKVFKTETADLDNVMKIQVVLQVHYEGWYFYLCVFIHPQSLSSI